MLTDRCRAVDPGIRTALAHLWAHPLDRTSSPGYAKGVTAPPTPAGRPLRAMVVQGVVAILGTGAALWWAFRGVDFDKVAQQFRAIPVSVLLIVLGSQLFLHLVRSARWGLLVRPLGPASRRQVLTAASLGFSATFFFPLRLGEFVRPALISRAGVPFLGAMAAVVVERIIDGLMGVGLLFFLLGLLADDLAMASELATVGKTAFAAFGGGVLFLAFTVAAKAPAFSLIRGTVGRLAPGFTEKVLALVSAFIDGLAVLKDLRRVAGFLALTAVFWLTNCVALWLIPEALVPGIPMSVGPFIIAVTTFTIMIPSGPGFAGTLEVGFVLAMAPFGVEKADAISTALAFHLVQATAMALVGGFGLLIAENKNLREDASTPVVE